jgi:hypothetical protein
VKAQVVSGPFQIFLFAHLTLFFSTSQATPPKAKQSLEAWFPRHWQYGIYRIFVLDID